MTFGSLFSGIGGFDLGLERAGMTCAWQVEKDEFCQKVLAKHWPNVPRFGDIKEVHSGDLQPVDLICGGFPCQDISMAGRRVGIGGERSGLWSEMARLICELRPRYVLVENVSALLYPVRKRGRIIEPAPIGRVLGDLAASGYDAEWQVLPAAAFGAPHIRERVFVLAYTRSEQQRREPLSLAECTLPTFAGNDGKQGAMADTNSNQRAKRGQQQQEYSQEEGDVAYANGQREQQQKGGFEQERYGSCNSGEDVADTNRKGLAWGAKREIPKYQLAQSRERSGQHWATEPDVGRMAYGVPKRVDRLRALGNAVVPQVVEHIGRCILAVEAQLGTGSAFVGEV